MKPTANAPAWKSTAFAANKLNATVKNFGTVYSVFSNASNTSGKKVLNKRPVQLTKHLYTHQNISFARKMKPVKRENKTVQLGNPQAINRFNKKATE